METIEHVLLYCIVFNKEREVLIKKLKDLGIANFSLSNILSCVSEQSRVQREVINDLKITGLVNVLFVCFVPR